MAKIRVWNTKAGKHHYIHPDLSRDKVWMQQRGMILDPEVKIAPVQFTNPTPAPTPKAPIPPKTTETNGD